MESNKFYTVDEATKVLEKYCAYQERCHKEVENKLYELNLIPEAKEKILLHLMQHNFLNEERFSKTFVRGKFSIKKWGKTKLKYELKLRNVSEYNIKTALNEIDENAYLESLKTLAEKKSNSIKETNRFIKSSKVSKYLISKGYETSLVYDVVKKIVL